MTSNTYDMLLQQRDALSKAMRMALIIERLNRSLEAMMISEKSGDYLPQQAVRFYDQLDPQIQSISTPMLKEFIGKLEQRVEVDFKLILDITRVAGDPTDHGASLVGIEDIGSFIEEFFSHAQRLVGLRVLLHKRGEHSKGLKLEVPTQSLQKQSKRIADLEASYRVKVRHDVVQLKDDTLALFESPGLEESMRTVLQQTYEDLQVALEHIDGGGDLADLPVMVQTIHIDSTPLNGELFYAQAKEMNPEKPSAPDQTAAAAVEPPPQASVGRRSFWQALRIWLNTPLRVSWRDVRNGKA